MGGSEAAGRVTAQEDLETSLGEHRRLFREVFGKGGERIRVFFSPGRVNLLGAHLDYNGGPVMPMAIDRGTFLVLRPREDAKISLASTLEEEVFEANLDALPERKSGHWYDYPLGVLLHMLDAGKPARGMDALFGGNLAVGAGLSSSASICVGTAFAFDRVWERGSDVLLHIQAALFAEREFVGVKCGIMDPYAVALTRPGHLLWLDCKDASHTDLPLDSREVTIAVADTGVRRELAQVAFNERVAECSRAFELLAPHSPGATCLRDVSAEVVEANAASLEGGLLERARHVVQEVERTFSAREALERGDLDAFGRAISGSHASLRDLYAVSIPELDLLVDAALEWPGVLGARLTGAGFGGCVVILVRTAACAGLDGHLREVFESRFGAFSGTSFYRGDSGPRELEL